jgi:hypothetical protein
MPVSCPAPGGRRICLDEGVVGGGVLVELVGAAGGGRGVEVAERVEDEVLGRLGGDLRVDRELEAVVAELDELAS